MEVRIHDRFRSGDSSGQPIGDDTEQMLALWHCAVNVQIREVLMLLGRVRSIEYECHGSREHMRVFALVIVINPPMTPGDTPRYYFANHAVDVVAGSPQGQEFVTGIVDAAARAAGLMRTKRKET